MAGVSEYTQEIASAICERIAEGASLRSICRDEAMPAQSTVFKWLVQQPAFAEQYAHAREAQADALADEIIDIADDGKRDSYKDADGVEHVDHDHIARARLRVDSRKWIASKLKPKKYGEKQDINLSGDITVEVVRFADKASSK